MDDRNLDPLAAVCSANDMDRIRRFRFLFTQEEMDEFIKWALEHDQPKVRGMCLFFNLLHQLTEEHRVDEE
ncbi:MAG TPA: hypothetical protein VGO47_10420 [Chlamydiales bacterium]|nr:hypothetical protein [Chlamydiales bacterium]